jgi:nucleoside 2-deoxyribosyltransferase
LANQRSPSRRQEIFVTTQALAPRIYLAGPEVFLPDPIAAGRRKVEIAARYGLTGLYPLDAALDLTGLGKVVQAQRISRANEELMHSADGLIANLTPFRGISMDCGTAFEVGFMRALGRPVLGYSNIVTDYAVRATQYRQRGIPPGDADRTDVAIEDFYGAENLMITAAIEASGSSVIRRAAEAGRELDDLAAYEVCLNEARRIFCQGS